MGLIPTRHVGTGGFVHPDGTDTGKPFQLIPEIGHSLADLGTAGIVVLQLIPGNGGADLVGPSLHPTQGDVEVILQVLRFLDVVFVVAFVDRY